MATKTKAVAKASGDLPAYLANVGPVTKDNFTAEDVILPQVKLLQGTSEQVASFNDANPGLFWHTGMDRLLGDSVDFIPCSRRRKYLLMAPMFDGRGVLARADDGVNWDRTGEWTVQIDKKTSALWKIEDTSVASSGLADWGTHDPDDESSPPAATLFYEYLVVLPEHMELGPCVMMFGRSTIRKAKKGLNDKIGFHMSAGRPIQALRFNARAVDDQNNMGQSFFNWHFTSAGFATEDEYTKAKELADLLHSYRVANEEEQDGPGSRDADDKVPF